MADYSDLTIVETILMTLVAVFTNAAGIPTAMRTFKNKFTFFEGMIFSMSLISAFFYHVC